MKVDRKQGSSKLVGGGSVGLQSKFNSIGSSKSSLGGATKSDNSSSKSALSKEESKVSGSVNSSNISKRNAGGLS